MLGSKLGACLLATTAMAAWTTCKGAAAQTANQVGEVVVTASRLQSAGFTAPTPTTVVGTEELTRRAAVSVQETLSELPNIRSNTSPQQGASAINGSNGNAGASLVDMHGLGTNRTLTLVNGHRSGATSDLRQFPTSMVKRIEVVTGGASAAYGSDAVGGVVNVILDTALTGFKGNLQYQATRYGDDKGPAGSLVWGGDVFGDRGHLLVGGEFSQTTGAHTNETNIKNDKRPWFADNRGLNLANPCPFKVAVPTVCPTGGNGLPYFISTHDINFSTMNPGGIITAGPLRGTTFDDGGIPRPFQYGILIGNNQLGGEGVNPTVWWMRPYERHYSALGHFDYKLTEKLGVWLEYANAYNNDKVNIQSARDQGNLTIQRDNAFIPASIRAEMTRLNLATLTMGRLNNDGEPGVSENTGRVYRFAGGLKGKITDTWGWDAYLQYGLSKRHYETDTSRDTAKFRFAIDAVTNPQGVAVCRAALQNNPAAAGCVPFNIFGPNASSQAARDYVFGVQSGDNQTEQYNAQLNVHGELFSTWAGPIIVAAGGEYRREASDNRSDPIANAGGWDSGNAKNLSGKYNVLEGYVEAGVPLAKDMTFARSLDLNAAFRYADYSSVKEGVTTYKVGLTWRPIDDLLLRTTYSKDVRAPSINELYSPGGVAQNGFTQYQGPQAGQTTLVQFISTGNPNLRPETGKTLSVGGAYSPRFIPGLRLSADYYDIHLTDQIGSVGVQVIGDLCRQGRQEFCALITFNGQGTVLSVLNTNVNNASFRVRGVDLEAAYSLPLDVVSLPGAVNFRAMATRTFEFATTTVGGREDKVGQIPAGVLPQEPPNMPYWLGSYSATYNLGKFTGGVSLKYVSKGVVESQSIDGAITERLNNRLPRNVITNFNASYQILDEAGRKLQVYGAVNNAFNQGPPFPVFPVTNWAAYYDTLGTQFRAGIRFEY